ncbi:thioredoxin family protein [Arundinibacter roseus]|uniref:Thioredoxin family protein n=1 Tax=Arundinibacter roseus TaxID=2070510 RepID=A0A4R4KBL9_9BACT|nr:thioredoxin family protein [Arundinibacter roseus]TDB64152.1 thioredoxin family protein [Arundinibacter roseus]
MKYDAFLIKKYVSFFGVLLLLVAIGSVSFSTASERFSASQNSKVLSEGYQIGDAVSNFRLKNVDSRMISLSDYSSQKGVIVVFSCNHCPFAKAYEERVIALDRKFGGQGFPVIAINPTDPAAYEDDTFEQMQARARSKGFTYPYLVDATQTVAKAFGATRTPHVFVLTNNNGTFTVRYIGTIDDNPQDPSGVSKRYVDDAVTNLLAGKPVVTTTTKAIGCAIKWKDV